jgi:hypothetical protein
VEFFGICCFGVPAAAVASTFYCMLAAYAMTRWPLLRWVALVGSLFVGACLVGEVVLLTTWGAQEAYYRLGIIFVMIHETALMLGPPAVANLILLLTSVRSRTWKAWKVAVAFVFCWTACVAGAFWNIYVDEAIVGPDAGAPYYMTAPQAPRK